MFNPDIGRKQRTLEAAESRYDQARNQAENLGLTGYDLRDNLAELWSHVVLASEQYQKARSQRIIQRARRLEIPIPEINDSGGTWGRGTTFEGRFLTDLGVRSLRTQIRAEQRERYESWSRWIVLAIGLIGAVTGLVAVISTLS